VEAVPRDACVDFEECLVGSGKGIHLPIVRRGCDTFWLPPFEVPAGAVSTTELPLEEMSLRGDNGGNREVLMAHTVHGDMTTTGSQTIRHWALTFLAVLGIVAAALGAWMVFAPADATLTVFWWTWDVSAITETWAAWMMILGGLVTSAAIGWEAVQSEARSGRWLIAFETVIVVAGLAAFVVGVFRLF
jgi:hypothetical protein